MPYSYAVTTPSSPTTSVAVPFPYINKDHVTLQVDGEIVDPLTYTWSTDSTLATPTINAGSVVKVFRTTPADDMFVVFTSGNLEHQDLNDGYNQLLFIVQELLDGLAAVLELFDQILDYLTQIQEMYDQILLWYNQIEDWYNTVETYHDEITTIYANLNLYYDISITVPYSLYDGDLVGSFVAPQQCNLPVADITANWRCWTLMDTHAACTYYVYLLDGSYNTSTHIATFTIAQDANGGSVSAVIGSTLDLPAGTKLKIVAQNVDSFLEDVHFHLTIRRGAII